MEGEVVMVSYKYLCTNCRKSFKGKHGTCGCSAPALMALDPKIRVPKINASKPAWKKFKQFLSLGYGTYYKDIAIKLEKVKNESRHPTL